ncbi:hypothetical protein PRZ48_004467 [Zasmidium cellare]|uniref:Uncharacterized protein n=1 Tax=Zasmidium cellare TaxID=395010 RepID=A0ABR0EPK6_ZASCE|nr:hypothetical protein PRZ48_004467 [Zasmidium cellare]
MVYIANGARTTATSLFAERDARIARFRAKRAQDHEAVASIVEESRSLSKEKGEEEKKAAPEGLSLVEETEEEVKSRSLVEMMKVAVEEHSLEQREKTSWKSARSLEQIYEKAREDGIVWPEEIPKELGPELRPPQLQNAKQIEVLGVTFCGAVWRLANVRLGHVLESGMVGCKGLDDYKDEGKLSLEWAERRKAYQKRRNSLVVEAGDLDDRD